MAVRASLHGLLNLGSAHRLLDAADRGAPEQVEQLLLAKPQLATYVGLWPVPSPLAPASAAALARAAAGGHVAACRAVVAALRASAAAAEAGGAPARARRLRALLRTALEQRTHSGLTPLLAAAAAGHAEVLAFLLAAGADPLAVDPDHGRSALHLAAAGGHAAAVAFLCSDAARARGGGVAAGPLRDALVRAADDEAGAPAAAAFGGAATKFVDARAAGGLTPLHFAVAAGALGAVTALLRGGAALMPRSAGDALVGEEVLLPAGSTPLHLAAALGAAPAAAALLAAHAALLGVAGGPRDARGRRGWEGHSRSDCRSARDARRRLPYHLARDRGHAAVAALLDPRLPADLALDAARDAALGTGARRLATMAAEALQRGLLEWLDARAAELAAAAAAAAAEAAEAAAAAAASHAPTVRAAPARAFSAGAAFVSPFAAAAGAGGWEAAAPRSAPCTPPERPALGGGGAASAPPRPALSLPPRRTSLHELVAALGLLRAPTVDAAAVGAPPRALALARGASSPPPGAGLRLVAVHALAGAAELTAAPSSPKLEGGKGGSESDDGCGAAGRGGTGAGDAANSAERAAECGVCLDRAVEVGFRACGHALCVDCARTLTRQARRPPSCPFCRAAVVGFVAAPAACRAGG